MSQQPNNLEKVYVTSSGRLKSLAKKYRLNAEDTEDVIQSVFEKAIEHNKKLDDVVSIDAWLTTIVKNECINKIRKSSTMTQNTGQIKHHLTMQGETRTADILQKIKQELGQNHLDDYISDAKPGQETSVAKMFYIKGRNSRDISQDLGMNLNTVTSHLRRFRARYTKHCRCQDIVSIASQKAELLVGAH
ncbi:MAG: sigma-70 family RNA polymerase sigma factor [Pseudobacteriovorax sp.]|nr:sigma-70 family RNA polymerase sigma factor [Pseudobacteriovorax sp.]